MDPLLQPILFQGRWIELQFVLDYHELLSSVLFVRLLPEDDRPGCEATNTVDIFVPTFWSEPDAFFKFIEKMDYSKSFFSGRIVETNRLVDADRVCVQAGIDAVVRALMDDSSKTCLIIADELLCQKGESYQEALDAWASQYDEIGQDFAHDLTNYLQKMHLYILSALRNRLEADVSIESLTARLQGVNIESKKTHSFHNGALISTAFEEEHHGKKRSERQQARFLSFVVCTPSHSEHLCPSCRPLTSSRSFCVA